MLEIRLPAPLNNVTKKDLLVTTKDSTRTVPVETDPSGTFDVIENSLRDLWTVVDELARVSPPRSGVYRTTIFGSARMRPGDELYKDVRRLAAELAKMGCDIVTGGGPGLMQAANEGEHIGDTTNRTRSIGLPIDLPSEEAANPFVEQLYKHRTFFTRLHHFVRLSDAFVVVRGGIGTTLEMMMIWQLLQVRHIHDKPLVFIGGMWEDLVAWAATHMVEGEQQLASPQDLTIPRCVPSVEEAVEVIRTHKEGRGVGSGPLGVHV